jgi:hypothetical protein
MLEVVDGLVIVAIIGITELFKRALPEHYWRATPLITLALGVLAGWFSTPASADARAIFRSSVLYAGAAAIFYEIGRTAILGWGSKGKNGLELPK